MSRRNRRPGLIQGLPSMLTYPLRGAMPFMLGALCLLSLLEKAPGLIGLVFWVLCTVFAFKLAVEALINTAHGRYEPLAADELTATDGEAFKQLVLQFLISAGLVAAMYFGGWKGLLWALAAMVLLEPAVVILLAMEGRLFAALNPLQVLRLIGRLGGAYFAVVAVVAVLVTASAFVEGYLQARLPSIPGHLLASVVSLYSLILIFHVLGDLIHRHHDVLGLDVEPAVPRATFGNPFEDETMAAAERAVGEGRREDAIALLGELFRGRGASDPVHDRWREYVIASGDVDRLTRHDREYIASLLATGKDRRALAVFSETRRHDPRFVAGNDETMARLVETAANTGQARLAVQIAEGFEQQFPGSPFIPRVVHAVAWTMADQFEQTDAALLRVQKAMRIDPAHPLNEALHALALKIDKLPKFARG
ncbi:hypothetical protein [Arenimonas composti]|uniref:DUF4013 domain-containing protein n=1 Tax=Arenimonas composti TR7-09 = DSM 18010 TaxID=1121013 RepID=A0A091BI65_9GAMM|nr:hypothetical protein [Arenimonas composti]KFN50459.1 hypothetical protein P873_07290 [Arenimonas composti TR7-09 = DSM 18010]